MLFVHCFTLLSSPDRPLQPPSCSCPRASPAFAGTIPPLDYLNCHHHHYFLLPSPLPPLPTFSPPLPHRKSCLFLVCPCLVPPCLALVVLSQRRRTFVVFSVLCVCGARCGVGVPLIITWAMTSLLRHMARPTSAGGGRRRGRRRRGRGGRRLQDGGCRGRNRRSWGQQLRSPLRLR